MGRAHEAPLLAAESLIVAADGEPVFPKAVLKERLHVLQWMVIYPWPYGSTESNGFLKQRMQSCERKVLGEYGKNQSEEVERWIKIYYIHA